MTPGTSPLSDACIYASVESTAYSVPMTSARRAVLLLDAARYERLERAATRSGSSVTSVIHHAIDRMLVEDSMQPSVAGTLLLNAPPMDVEAWEKMKQQLLNDAT